jgi:hypothetical protein
MPGQNKNSLLFAMAACIFFNRHGGLWAVGDGAVHAKIHLTLNVFKRSFLWHKQNAESPVAE